MKRLDSEAICLIEELSLCLLELPFLIQFILGAFPIIKISPNNVRIGDDPSIISPFNLDTDTFQFPSGYIITCKIN